MALSLGHLPEPVFVVTERPQGEPILRRLRDETKSVGYDTETEGWDPDREESPCGKAKVAFFSVAGQGWASVIDGKFFGDFKPWLEDETKLKTTANENFERHVALNHGVRLRGGWIDVVHASFTLNPSRQGRHSVKKTSADYLRREMKNLRELFPDADMWRAWVMERETAVDYSAKDALNERDLGEFFAAELDRQHLYGSETTLWQYYCDFQRPFSELLFEMEREGMLVDGDRLETTLKGILPEIDACLYRIAKTLGKPVKGPLEKLLNTPHRLARILYRERGLEILDTTGKYSCVLCWRGIGEDPEAGCRFHPGASVMETPSTKTLAIKAHALAGDPLARDVVYYRHYIKLRETAEKTLRSLDENGVIHTTFNPWGARSTRLSTKAPNLLSVPKPGKDLHRIRDAFIAPLGCEFLNPDYNQLEYRLLAHISNEPVLIDAFARGEDFHSLTATLMNVERKLAKNGNFGLNYGAGIKKLMKTLGCSRAAAEAFADKHRATYPTMYAWRDDIMGFGERRGFVANILGFPRPIPEFQSPNKRLRSKGRRICLNNPIQGSAAAVVQSAMLRLAGKGKYASKEAERLRELGASMRLQVHDELAQYAPKAAVAEVIPLAKALMENPLGKPLRVALPTEWKVGRSWGEASEYGKEEVAAA